MKSLRITNNNQPVLTIPIPTRTQRRRFQLWTELGVVCALVAVALFIANARGICIGAGLVWLYLTTDWREKKRHNLGLCWENSKKTTFLIEIALIASIAIWIVGLIWGPARHITYDLERLFYGKLGYFLGAAFQQFVLQSYCFTRLEKLLGNSSRACIWTARAFSLFHLPNPLLMVITWYGGTLSCGIFCKYRNLYTLALAHGIIGASLAAFWPSWVMRVGIGFIRIISGS